MIDSIVLRRLAAIKSDDIGAIMFYSRGAPGREVELSLLDILGLVILCLVSHNRYFV